MSETIVVAAGQSELVGERWPGGAPVVVLLHAGVADRRSWREVAQALAGPMTIVAYDRRGYGESLPSLEPFTHVDDLLVVLDRVTDEPAWLVGSSMGGGLALDTALVAPQRVAGLVLLAPAVSGAPEPEIDPSMQRFEEDFASAMAANDLEWVNRLDTSLWLDGPAGPEGRVGGERRTLALEMNATILHHNVDEDAGTSGVDAWRRLAEVQQPTTVACGDLDAPFLMTRSRELAGRLACGRYRELEGMAHLPYLEQPKTVANVISESLTVP